MPEETPTHRENSSVGVPAGDAVGGKGLRWFELCLVLVIAFGTPLFGSFDLLRNGGEALPHVYSYRWVGSFVREVAALCLLGYVLRRRKLRFRDIGLQWGRWDLAFGVVLAIGAYVAYAAGYEFVYFLHQALGSDPAGGVTARQIFGHPSWMAIPFALLNPFFEELIVRAYLMTEIKDLTGSIALACAASVALQTSYHLYYGWVMALSLSFQFLLFSIYYAKTRKATPVILAHEIFDLFGLLRLM